MAFQVIEQGLDNPVPGSPGNVPAGDTVSRLEQTPFRPVDHRKKRYTAFVEPIPDQFPGPVHINFCPLPGPGIPVIEPGSAVPIGKRQLGRIFDAHFLLMGCTHHHDTAKGFFCQSPEFFLFVPFKNNHFFFVVQQLYSCCQPGQTAADDNNVTLIFIAHFYSRNW